MVKKGKIHLSSRSIRESRRMGIFHRPRTDEVQRKFCLHYVWTLHLHVRQIMHDSFDLSSSPTINSSRWTSNQEMQKLAKEKSFGCWLMPWSCVGTVQNILLLYPFNQSHWFITCKNWIVEEIDDLYKVKRTSLTRWNLEILRLLYLF